MGALMKNSFFLDNKEDFDNSDIGVYCLDEDRRITYWNKKAEEITGYTADEMMGKYCFEGGLDHITEDDVHLCNTMCPMLGSMFDGEKRAAEVWLLSKSQDRIKVKVETDCLYDGDKTIGAIEFFRLID